MRSFVVVLFLIGFTRVVYGQCTFTYSPNNPCPGSTVTFTVTNPMMGSVYTWDLDGDNMNDDGTGTMVTYTYPFNTSPASVVVKLFKDGTNCNNNQTVMVRAAPDPSIGVVSGQPVTGNVIRTCNSGQSDTLEIINTSTTHNVTTLYTINWGDGSPLLQLAPNDFIPNTTVLQHAYSGLGYKNLVITATHSNGCTASETYQYFIGSNPSVGLANPGNTVGLCAPSTISFPLTNYLNNPPGTTYEFFLNATSVALYNQSNVPANFTFTFDQTSCGETTPLGEPNAFAITVEAKNPCGSSKASVEPITLSTKPVPDFSIQGPQNQCPEEEFTFTNTSTNINEYNTVTEDCVNELSANWMISPGTMGVNYILTSGTLFNNNEIKVKFLTPGTYTIKMTITPTPVCGPAVITQTITILEPPTALAAAQFSNTTGCAPLTVTFDNLSTGYQTSYNWTITPAMGWQFINGSSASSFEPTVQFNTAGTYTVTLTATNVCDEDTWTLPVVVKTLPSIQLPMLGPFCQTTTLNFGASNTQYNNGNGTISNYAWSFPGGTPSSSNQQYPTNILYNVTAGGCASEINTGRIHAHAQVGSR